jgi:hypothetical protein
MFFTLCNLEEKKYALENIGKKKCAPERFWKKMHGQDLFGEKKCTPRKNSSVTVLVTPVTINLVTGVTVTGVTVLYLCASWRQANSSTFAHVAF